eukprot:792885-Pyramimonas_sp.AAC.1
MHTTRQTRSGIRLGYVWRTTHTDLSSKRGHDSDQECPRTALKVDIPPKGISSSQAQQGVF